MRVEQILSITLHYDNLTNEMSCFIYEKSFLVRLLCSQRNVAVHAYLIDSRIMKKL